MLVVRQKLHQLHDLGSSTPFPKGGEARIFPFPNDKDTLAKIYDKPGTNDRLKKVTTLIANPFPAGVRGLGGVVGPNDWLTDPTSGEFLGYTMPRVWNAEPIVGSWSPLSSEYRPFATRYRIARKIAELFVQIQSHKSDVLFADVNPQNLLLDVNDDVWLIDLDSCQMTGRDGQLLISPMWTLEFLSPRLQNKNLEHVTRTRPDENFAVSALLFRLLMDGFNPNDARAIDMSRDVPNIGERILRGVWAFGDKPTHNFLPPTKAPDFGDLPDHIRALFSRCFVEGFKDPYLRPSPKEWHDAFSQKLTIIHPSPIPAPLRTSNPVIPPPVTPVVPQPAPAVAPHRTAYVQSPQHGLTITLSRKTQKRVVSALAATLFATVAFGMNSLLKNQGTDSATISDWSYHSHAFPETSYRIPSAKIPKEGLPAPRLVQEIRSRMTQSFDSHIEAGAPRPRLVQNTWHDQQQQQLPTVAQTTTPRTKTSTNPNEETGWLHHLRRTAEEAAKDIEEYFANL